MRGFILLFVVCMIGWVIWPARICSQPMTSSGEDDMIEQRQAMVRLLRQYGIRDERVIEAMATVKRHRFLPSGYASRDAYGDHPLPIGHRQTISQPFIVAYMTEAIAPKPGEKILEIGTGSGYQAAILAHLGANVYTIEIIPELASHAISVLASESKGVRVKTGDGYKGWPEEAPFDAIIVTCAPEEVPQALVDQLRDGGRMILPVGPTFDQRLVILRKTGGQILREDKMPVRFVPMVPGTN